MLPVLDVWKELNRVFRKANVESVAGASGDLCVQRHLFVQRQLVNRDAIGHHSQRLLRRELV